MFKRLNDYYSSNFAKRILFLLAILYIVLLICFICITYFLTSMYIISDTQKNLTNISNSITTTTDEYMTAKTSPLQMLSTNTEIRSYLTDFNKSKSVQNKATGEVYALLESTTEYDTDILGAWLISDKHGDLIGTNSVYCSSENFKVTSQSWYTPIISSSKSDYIWFSSTSSGLISKEPVITAITAVIENGNIIGYCGIEISSSALYSHFDNYSTFDGSFPVLLSTNNGIIYSPTSKAFTDNFDIESQPIAGLLVQPSSISRSETFSVGNVNHYIKYNRSPITGWSTVIIFDGNVIKGNMNRLFIQEVIILACLFVIMYIITANIITNQSKTLSLISSGLTTIKSGTYSFRISIKSKNELGMIAKDINFLAEDLQHKFALLDQYSNHDQLTGLLNRQSFFEIATDVIVPCTEENTKFAILFLDIDNFKWINDALGHSYGDEVLVIFGKKLSQCLGEYAKIARFSGDEFVILMKIGNTNDDITAAVEKLKSEFDNPISVLSDTIYIKYSIGISIFPDDDTTADMLIRDADIAVHKAKERGKGRVAYFNNRLHRNIVSKTAISQQLNAALDKNELFLNYQPIISTKTGDIYGFEVLIRWKSEELGFVSPGEFINIAEETGAIIPIGTWIFESACRFQKKLYEHCRKDLVISINVSPIQLKKSNYLEHVKRVLEITGIDPKFVQIEITESTLIDFTSSNNNIIDQICDLGISLALDDFGTGYSSLNYLKNFPIKCLKVDKSFVDEIYTNRKDYAITDSIIDLVHNLNIKTVAEGVETVGQFNALVDMKCDYIQGFLMSKPLEEDEMLEFVKKYDALHKPDRDNMAQKELTLAVEREEQRRLSELEKELEEPITATIVDED